MGCCNDTEMRTKNMNKNSVNQMKESKQEQDIDEPQFKSEPNILLNPKIHNEEARSDRREQDVLPFHQADTFESMLLDEILENYNQCKHFYQEHDIDQAHYYADKFM